MASCHFERVRGPSRSRPGPQSHTGTNGFRHWYQRFANILSGGSDGREADNMKNTVDPWAGRMGAESALLARDGFSGPEHIIDGKEGLFAVFKHVQYKGEPATFDREALVAELPNSTKSHYRILDCGMKSFPIEALSHAPLTAM